MIIIKEIIILISVSIVLEYKKKGLLTGHSTSLLLMAIEMASALLDAPSLFNMLLT